MEEIRVIAVTSYVIAAMQGLTLEEAQAVLFNVEATINGSVKQMKEQLKKQKPDKFDYIG